MWKPLPRPVRRTVLVVHVAVSVGWLGLTLGLLALAVTGAVNDAAATDEIAYGGMKIFVDWLVPPVALLSLTTGLVLSLGTHWGLARHRWVYTKFWLTLIAITASLTALRDGVGEAAAEVAAGQPVDAASAVAPPTVSLALYTFLTAISVLKPWGPTRRGRRAREARRAARGPDSGRAVPSADRTPAGTSTDTSAGTSATAHKPVAGSGTGQRV